MRRSLLILAMALVAGGSSAVALRAQAGAAASSKIPDLSGDWQRDVGWQSISLADPQAKLRGKEPDIPYQPWALEKTMKEVPPTGPDARPDITTDPYIRYCEPLGIIRVYLFPGRTKFVQTPDDVYILHEVSETFRVVRMNSKHPDDPDPQYWGDSIGWYENGDTLVVDSIGFNDRSWLDQQGKPHTDKLHVIERYKRLDKDTIQLDFTIDDPGAYTKPFNGQKKLTQTKVPFMQNPWVCSVRELQDHEDKLSTPASPDKKIR
jgi:hypothetical protein